MTQEAKDRIAKVKSGQIEQQKILRVFELIKLLDCPNSKPVYRLKEVFACDERTIYRYFKLLEALGFELEKKFSKYKIKSRPQFMQCEQCGKQMNNGRLLEMKS